MPLAGGWADGLTYSGNLFCVVLERGLHVLDAGVGDAAVEALMLVGDGGDDAVQLLVVRDVDLAVVQATLEVMGQVLLRLVEALMGRRGPVEAVDVAACLDEHFGEG